MFQLRWAEDSTFCTSLSFSLLFVSHLQDFWLSSSLSNVAAETGHGLSPCSTRVTHGHFRFTAHTSLSWGCVKSTVSSIRSIGYTECLLGTYVGVLICPGCISLVSYVIWLPIIGCIGLTVCAVSHAYYSVRIILDRNTGASSFEFQILEMNK